MFGSICAAQIFYSQNAPVVRSAMSTWKWLRWALLASGPSTVPKMRQAEACACRRKSVLRGSGNGACGNEACGAAAAGVWGRFLWDLACVGGLGTAQAA